MVVGYHGTTFLGNLHFSGGTLGGVGWLTSHDVPLPTTKRCLGCQCRPSVDGSEIWLTHQLRERYVEIPLFTRFLAPSKRWLGMGFLNRQQYFSDELLVLGSYQIFKGAICLQTTIFNICLPRIRKFNVT